MKRTLITLIAASTLVATAILAASKPATKASIAPIQQQPNKQRKPRKQAKVDLVIALDTSGSMSGLINAAREKLWDIVNEVGRAQPAPRLRVALLTYGSRGNEDDGYVVVRSGLTTDLDSIYSKLFELRTSGGTEYVGRVVHRATQELSWDQDHRTLKQIFVAGNESADQDRSVRASRAVRLARARGIFVNAIYCGPKSGRDARSWRKVAQGGKGVFASIDHNHGTVVVATPYDRRINKLSAKLNRTYVAYGSYGGKGAAMQRQQDKNAEDVHAGVAAARAVAKSSGVYNNAKWDLVDARKEGKLESIKPAALPKPLRSLSKRALNHKLDQMQRERAKIRQEIRALSKKRRAYAANKMKRKGVRVDKAFDTAVKRAVQVQAEAMGIELK